MRVVNIISSYSPGEAEILARDLCLEMKKKGLEVELWAMAKGRYEKFGRKFNKFLDKK